MRILLFIIPILSEVNMILSMIIIYLRERRIKDTNLFSALLVLFFFHKILERLKNDFYSIAIASTVEWGLRNLNTFQEPSPLIPH